MPIENTITISIDRFQQLIRAEHDANLLNAIIMDADDSYTAIDYRTVLSLRAAFCGKKEDIEV